MDNVKQRKKSKTAQVKNDESSFLSGENTERAPRAAVPSTYRDELGRFMDGNEGLAKRYTNPVALKADVLRWLELCDADKKVPTMTGLALSLGFRNRRSLLNYSSEPGYEEFYDIIQYAKMKIESFLEERLLDYRNTNIAGLIFNLKNNFDWVDKQDIRMDQRSLQLTGFNFVHPTQQNGKEE